MEKQNLSVNQRIFKELWVVDYMKAYEFAKENGVSDEEMQVVLHELNKEEAKMKSLEQLKNEIEVVRAEIEKAIEQRKPMSYLQELINLENTIGSQIVEKSA